MVLVALVSVVSGFSRTVIEAGSSTVTLAIPGRSNATPSIAAEGNTVVVAWSATLPNGGAADVFAAVSRDGGRTFAAPARVNDVDGDARVNGEQPPRVALRDAAITVVWTTKGANGTRLVQASSADGGRTFTKAQPVPGADAAGNRGWENIAAAKGAGASGRTLAVWLDHRELAHEGGQVAVTHHDHTKTAGAGADSKPDGVAMAQKSKLYIASLDGAVAPHAITGGVCYCCKTAIAIGADGSVYTAWRHVYPGNVRDIACSLSRDGGRTFAPPVRVSEDKWVLEGCPDDGPAMALSGDGRIHVVWPTLVNDGGEDTIALFYSVSRDGKSFAPRQRIPAEGMPHHPQITIGSDGTPTLAWDESASGTRRGAIARVSTDSAGVPRFARVVLGERAVYPVIAATADAAVVAWTASEQGGSRIRVERR
ncbi:MAG: exo-alpha-sialidase [Acidobacteria bacterium]|nr:exo-alpha-sialidase [Acidobacteriota bacterium]